MPHFVIFLRLVIDTIFPCFSGRELFLSDASLFVDDAEAYEKYNREEEPDVPDQKVILLVELL